MAAAAAPTATSSQVGRGLPSLFSSGRPWRSPLFTAHQWFLLQLLPWRLLVKLCISAKWAQSGPPIRTLFVQCCIFIFNTDREGHDTCSSSSPAAWWSFSLPVSKGPCRGWQSGEVGRLRQRAGPVSGLEWRADRPSVLRINPLARPQRWPRVDILPESKPHVRRAIQRSSSRPQSQLLAVGQPARP